MSEDESDGSSSCATSIDDASDVALPKTKQGYAKDDFVVSDSETSGGSAASEEEDEDEEQHEGEVEEVEVPDLGPRTLRDRKTLRPPIDPYLSSQKDKINKIHESTEDKEITKYARQAVALLVAGAEPDKTKRPSIESTPEWKEFKALRSIQEKERYMNDLRDKAGLERFATGTDDSSIPDEQDEDFTSETDEEATGEEAEEAAAPPPRPKKART